MKKNKILSREDFIKKIAENETNSVQERMLTEYNAFKSYLRDNNTDDNYVENYIDSRMAEMSTYYQKSNRIFNMEKMFSVMGIKIKNYVKNIENKTSVNKAFCTKDFILDVPMMNPADKFILLFYFWGIKDTGDQALRELKVRDIDLIERTIKVNGITINLKDDRELKIVRETLITDVYVTAKGVQPKRCSLSDRSPYVLRVKRTEKTQDGCSPMAYNTIKVRLQKINAELGTKFSKNSLRLSGIADRLYNINNTKYYWDYSKVRIWKDEENEDTFSITDVVAILNELYYK